MVAEVSARAILVSNCLEGFVWAALREIVGSSGSELIVVLFPTRIQINSSDWNLLTRLYGLNPEKFDLTYPDSRIENICESNKINCLFLSQAFRQSGKKLYLPRGDMHFNTDGQLLAAQEIAKYVANLTSK